MSLSFADRPAWAVRTMPLVTHDKSGLTVLLDDPELFHRTGAPSYAREWRLKSVEHVSQLGDPGFRFAEICQVDRTSIDGSRSTTGLRVGDCLTREAPGFQVHWYDVIASVERDHVAGRFWAIIHANFKGGPEEEAAFNDWYSNKHMLEVCANAGFHRAWRLRQRDVSMGRGRPEFRYWAVYEIDRPEDFAAVRERNRNPWDGLWQSHVEGFRRTYHEVIGRREHR